MSDKKKMVAPTTKSNPEPVKEDPKAQEAQMDKPHNIEELEQYIRRLHEELNKLVEANNQLRNNNAIMRVELLMKALEKEKFFPKEFIKECAEEIMEILTIPEEFKKKK